MLRSIEKLIGMPIPVQEVEGFDFSAALDSAESERPERGPRRGRPGSPRTGSPLSPDAARRGRSERESHTRRPPTGGREVARGGDEYSVHRRFEKPGRSDTGRGQERRGSASAGNTGKGSTAGRRDDGSGTRRSEGSAPRTRASQSRPQSGTRQSPEPRTTRTRPPQNDDLFGEGLFVEGSTEKSTSETSPARRRRKRPAQTNT